MLVAHFLDYTDEYLEDLRRKNMSPHTVMAYKRDLEVLAEHLNEVVEKDMMAKLEYRHFERAYSRQWQKSERTRARLLSSWRNYEKYLKSRNLVEYTILSEFKGPKLPSHLPTVVKEEDLANMLDNAKEDATKPNGEVDDEMKFRNYVICELLYGTGIRVSELVSINVEDIDYDKGWLSVVGKGSKERHVPIAKKALVALQEYLPTRKAAPGEKALFVGRTGKRLTTRRVEQCVRQWGRDNNLSFDVYPHALRHSYATHMLEYSGEIRTVQELLGHSSITTTQIYTHLNFKEIAEVYRMYHPRSKLRSPFGPIHGDVAMGGAHVPGKSDDEHGRGRSRKS